MEKLFEIQKILIDQIKKEPFYHRDIFNQITLENKITGIVGSRGVGKSTFLLHRVMSHNQEQLRALYVSADNLYFLEHRLLDIVDQLYKETDVRLLCIDEIHKYPNWRQELKNIADTYRNFKILFSGSSTIDIVHGKFDLSRRVTLHHLNGFSFREYLEFTQKQTLGRLDLGVLLSDHVFLAEKLEIPQILKVFKEYLRMGYYPFFSEFSKEFEKFQAVENTIQKTIYEDIATLFSLKTPTLLIIEKLYKYVLHSSPGELSVFKLANLLGKDFESVSAYLRMLEQARLIRFLYPQKTGKAFFKNPIKIYPENSNLMYAAYLPQTQDGAIGKIRETFVINQVQNAGFPIYFSDKGDFKIGDYIFEVGGKNKSTAQIKNEKQAYVLADNVLIGGKKTVPLYLFGFLY